MYLFKYIIQILKSKNKSPHYLIENQTKLKIVDSSKIPTGLFAHTISGRAKDEVSDHDQEGIDCGKGESVPSIGIQGEETLLDEFTGETGYNRKYASHPLSRWELSTILSLGDELIKLKVG